MADFAEIREKVSIEQAVEMLGLEVTKSGGQLRAPCPACGNGGPRALAITPSKGLAYCFSAGVGGDLIFLASHVDKCSLADAGNRLAAYFKIGQNCHHQIADAVTITRPVRLADVLRAIDKNCPSLALLVSTTGRFYDIQKGALATDPLAHWNLRQDDLTSQRDECVAFLAQLLG